MRILGLADLHIGALHLCSLEEQEAALTAVADLAIEQKVAVVVIAGDATHHANPSAKALAVLGRFFGRLAEDKGIHVVLVGGNHDPLVPAVAENFRGRVHVAMQPQIIQVGSVDIACLPYLPDSFVRAQAGGNAMKEEIARLLTSTAHDILRGFLAQRRMGIPLVLVAHGTVEGSVTSSEFSMGFVGGTEWRIAISDASEFDLAVVGHIHKHQSPAANIVVPGSLLALDFSETAPHGVILADPDELPKWRFVPTQVNGRVCTFDVPHQEVTVPVLVADAANYVDRGDKIRVRVTCDEATAREYPPSRITAALYAAGASLVQVELTVERPDRARDGSVTAELTPMMALGRYLEVQESPNHEAVRAAADQAVAQLREKVGWSAGGDLELRAIGAQDLLGIRDIHVDFDGHGVYALTGEVGVGKSTIGADAVRVALFGASRYGAKVSDLLVRQGADIAIASVELESVTGDRYRIVRKIKRGSRGAVSTLDVLAHAGDAADANEWRPLSTGRVADGQKVVDELLGGLTDETLVASSIVIQRAADAFTRARPEQRKALLAEAAGLSVYDSLGEISRKRLVDVDRELARQQALGEPLRPRAAAIPMIEGAIAAARTAVQVARARLEQAEKARDVVVEQLAAAQSELARTEDAKGTVKKLETELSDIEGEIAVWTRKKTVALEILAEREKYEGAKGRLAEVRRQVTLLEADQEKERAQETAHAQAEQAVTEMEHKLERLSLERERGRERISAQIEAAERQEKRLAASECPVIEQITDRSLPACTFLRDARADVAKIDELGKAIKLYSAPGSEESALVEAIGSFEIQDAPTTYAETVKNLRFLRAREVVLEKDVEIADKITRAEEVVTEHDAAVAKLDARRVNVRRDLTAASDAESQHAAALREVVALGEKKVVFGGHVEAYRREQTAAERDVAFNEGRLSEAQQAMAELAKVDAAIAISAVAVAAWKQLVEAWRACRVMVLESSVIPAVEDTANEILRRFPYGMQLAFSTQREKKSGEGLSEALDIEVLGGRAPIYEGCSGGQKTAVDFALHVAIALVVSRRAATRLRFLFADEPEGLDEPGRAAFAAIARWINEAFGLTVLVASHAADLVDALGGRRIDLVAGSDGSTVKVA